MPKEKRLFIVIVTGLSGAGKSVTLKAFEDIGFFCIDNLPTALIEPLVDVASKTSKPIRIALGVDIREKTYLKNFSEVLQRLSAKHNIEVLFLEAEDSVIIRRFKETRRPHPLGVNINKAINLEKAKLLSLRTIADRIIDTSNFTPHQLRKNILDLYHKKGRGKELTINLMSFGYKYGIPCDADLLMDVRFLPNPNFIESLREFKGTDKKIKKFVFSAKETKGFVKKFYELLRFLLPLYKKEGKSYLTIGIGCTGGRHRSPAIIEDLRSKLSNKGFNITVHHRELE